MKKLFQFFVIILFCFAIWEGKPVFAQEKPFYIGFYAYDYYLDDNFWNEDLDKLAAGGCNLLYLAVSDDSKEAFEQRLTLLAQRNIKIIPQLDFVYYRHYWSDEEMRTAAQRAANFINQFANNPQILAWSVKEEASLQETSRVAQYHQLILEKAQGTKFYTLHNHLDSAQNQPEPNPEIYGVNRYPFMFYWDENWVTSLWSPAFGLDWVRNQLPLFYEEAEKRGADFAFVFSAGGEVRPDEANQLARNSPVKDKVIKWAQDGRMGWGKFGDYYNFWKFYRNPGNGTKALAWNGVMEGARLIFGYHFSPKRHNLTLASTASQQGYIDLWTFGGGGSGNPSEDNPQLEEFFEAAQEIRQYERIISQMTKTDQSPFSYDLGNKFFSRAFTFPGFTGKIIVIHNANIGSWPLNSKYWFGDNDLIYINNDGTFGGYTPFTQPQEAYFTVGLQAGESVYDITTNNKLSQAGSNYKTSILPGSGKLIFVGHQEEANYLHNLIGKIPLSTATATATPLPSFSEIITHYGLVNPRIDLNNDGLVNGLDFGERI